MFFVFRGKKSGFFAILYWVGGYNNCKGKVVELSRPPPQNCRNALNTSWAGGPGLEQPWTPARGRPVTLIISSVLTPPQNVNFDPPRLKTPKEINCKAYKTTENDPPPKLNFEVPENPNFSSNLMNLDRNSVKFRVFGDPKKTSIFDVFWGFWKTRIFVFFSFFLRKK